MSKHGEVICKDILCNNDFMRYVGYTENNADIKEYFSSNTVRKISKVVTRLLQGVDPKGRPIIVPDETICNVMSEIYDSYRPQTGDIFTRYVVPNGQSEDYIQKMINQVIEIITNDVKVNLGMEEWNSKLSIWSTLYGDFNSQGLRQHPPIKILRKRPKPMAFHMNY